MLERRSRWLALVFCFTVVVGPIGSSVGQPPDSPRTAVGAVDEYERKGHALVAKLQSGEDPSSFAVSAAELTALADFVAGEFAVAYPSCGPHLGATLGVLDELDTISVEEIEHGYHEGRLLPEAPDFCYHARDLIVHPATVIVLVRVDAQGGRQQMLAEMLEVLAHVQALRQLFSLANPPEPSEPVP